MRQCRTHAGETLQHVEPARRQTLRLPVGPFQKTMIRHSELLCTQAQNSERDFRIARAEYGKPPHDSQRHHRTFERMWMNIRHARRPWSLEENDRAMRAS